MEHKEIKKHWDHLAKRHGLDLKTTTKTPTIKHLEINAFVRILNKFANFSNENSILEVGCGNGHNIFGLAKQFPQFKFHGIDYSEEMIAVACQLNEERETINIDFSVGDALKLSNIMSLKNNFDFVLTDRMLINLNSWDLQQQGIRHIVSCVKDNGYLIVIENFINSYSNQNLMREIIGLKSRTPDPYNKFINENEFEKFIINKLGFEFIYSENFGSLHDLILYVLLPHANEGKILYDHPLMESVTELLERLPQHLRNEFGNFGQNKLYVFKRS